MNRGKALPTLFALALCLGGCASGKVSAEALDKFGAAKSAVWFEFVVDIVDGPDVHYHQLVLSSEGGLCKHAQKNLPSAADAYLDLRAELDASEDPATRCDAEKNFWTDAASLTDKIYGEGVNLFSVQLRDPFDDPSAPPPTGNFIAGENASDNYFEASLQAWRVNPYVHLRNAVDCSKAQFWETEARLELEDKHDLWIATDGNAVVEAKGSDKLKVEVSGTLAVPGLAGADDVPAGNFEADGTFEHCEVKWTGEFELFL